MTAEREDGRRVLQRAVSLAALATLTAANLVGVWLALLLVAPTLGGYAGALTYGRWMPLHLDLQLYGWCSIPLIGLLFARFVPPENTRLISAIRFALILWCGALAAGAVTWLLGYTSGKIFLDWSGPAALGFTGAQLFTWGVLVCGWLSQRTLRSATGRPSRTRTAIDVLLLAALLAVPLVLHLAENPATYPPVNPHSGGATGHSLLASSLGVIGLATALPVLLGSRSRAPRRMRGPIRGMVLGYVANWVVYAVLPHGNASHHEIPQIVGLATLLIWPIWLGWWFRLFDWEPSQKRWLLTSGLWAALLVVDGYALFLPGVLERVKFTNALVAHAHVAMAGMLTSLNQLILISLAPTSRLAAALAARRPWLAWNVSCAIMVVALTALGWREGATQRLVADGDAGVTVVYLVRLASGVVMLVVSIEWLTKTAVAWRSRGSPVRPTAIAEGLVRQLT